MKTKTYYDTPLITELESNVINVTPDKDKYWIELDETIFYAESGGMPRDTGTINGNEVLDIKKLEDGTILHLLSVKLGGKVSLKVDKEYRLRRMQCHSTQHLMSAVFVEKFNMPTISAHYITGGTVDIDIVGDALSNEQIKEVEDRANELITENIPFKISYVTKEEAKKYTDDFSDYEDLKEFRLVTIPNLDNNLCGCMHVPSAMYLKGIMITAVHKIKDHLKIEMMCGDLLVENAKKYYSELDDIGVKLTSKIENVPNSVNLLIENMKELNSKLSNYKAKYLDLYSDNKLKTLDLNKINVVLESHDDLEMKDLQFLVSKYSNVKNLIIIGILKKNDGTSNLMIAKNKEVNNFSAREVFKEITTTYGYRGGGNDFIAQGGGKTFDKMEDIITEIVNKKLNK
jgi:alanyl-tRNA synthetase